MRIAQQTHLVSLELDTRAIDLDLVQVGFERALEGDRPTMEQIVERIRLLHKHGTAGGADGGCRASRCRGASSPGVRDRVLKLLRDAGILEHESRGQLAGDRPAAAALPGVARPARLIAQLARA